MKRIQEKVKDIVEVRPYNSIRDFIADPAETLLNYHFTDATADLMAKWLDGIASVHGGGGEAFALAGYRGVGKSHFLAALGALAANPELRTRVSETHVAFSAQRLQRRHYTVAYLRRGTFETLIDEFRAAMSSAFGLDGLASMSSFQEILNAASAKSGEAPFILLIDTAFERGARVVRDDGGFLSEIAEAAKKLNVFVGVALDDDIAGADGSNSAIVRSFSIDYLDQAHLYKVVNSYIFPKNIQMQPVLHEIYGYFREVLPSFRWSEQKFASLYPLHPAILEIAPYVRLYVHDFALLGFASEAGEKILGRPSNSLIALDEVYDNAEAGLRKIEDLNEAFAAYDTLNSTVVGKIPVMQRLQAKLILKALLLLSLDGHGGTANDICASVLIFEEADPAKAAKNVEDLLKKFAEALPNDISVVSDDGPEARYGFKVSSKESLNNALTDAQKKVQADAVAGVVRRVFQERFADSVSSAGPDTDGAERIMSQIVWRGGVRRGRILWDAADVSEPADGIDWEVFIDFADEGGMVPKAGRDVSRVTWKPDPLRPDEFDKIRSYHALSTDIELRAKFSDQIRASAHAHSLAVEKIVNRTFLEDGKLIIDGFDYNFTEDARAAQSLSELFSSMLEPLFETRYPAHPYFTRTLDHPDVASIVTDLYNGTRQDLADVQSHAQTFAFPLGIVKLEGTSFVPETGDRLAAIPIVADILKMVGEAGEATLSLGDVYAQLRKAPNGLVREAQQMLITALVAQRQIEFVTSSGNRINRRSLDLKIIWDDIVGIAKPAENSFSVENLKPWADLFIKDGGFKSLDRAQDRESLQTAFAGWSTAWKSQRVMERFSQLPDDVLNVRIWQVAARVSKTFGSIAERIEAAAEDSMALEDCLVAIADAFSGSQLEFNARRDEFEVLSSFVTGAERRDEIVSFLSVCEATTDENIEALRENVVGLLEVSYAEPSDAINREVGYVWDKFRRQFSDHFVARHTTVMRSGDLKRQLDEILKTDEWWEFDMLSNLPHFDQRYVKDAGIYRGRVLELECNIDAKQNLEHHPFCVCGFSLVKNGGASHLPDLFKATVSQGLRAFRKSISKNCEDLVKALSVLAKESNDAEVAIATNDLVAALVGGADLAGLTDIQLKLLRQALEKSGTDLTRQTPIEAPPFQETFEGPADSAVVINI